MSTTIIAQTTTESKPHRPNITWDDHDYIQVNGFAKMRLQGWLNWTDRAVAALEAAHERYSMNPEGFQLTGHEEYARKWVIACFADGNKSLMAMIEFYKNRRPLFASPGDLPNTVYCSKCGALLTNRISKAMGRGPVCRTSPIAIAAGGGK